MVPSIALAALLYALPIAAQTPVTSSEITTAIASQSTDITITDSAPHSSITTSAEFDPEDYSWEVYSTATYSHRVDYLARTVAKINGTSTGDAASSTSVVDNAGSGIMVKSAGVLAGVACALAIILMPPEPLSGPLCTRSSLTNDLRNLGLKKGNNVLVHCSLSKIGWINGGAETLTHCLLDILTPQGTLVVPTQTSSNSDPALWIDPPVPQDWWQTIRDTMPAFNPQTSRTQRMGVLAETVRTWPGALRSLHPQTSFSAVGENAAFITRGHALDCMLGEHSPLARLEELDAMVLLVGVDFNKCTCFHLAEYRIGSAKAETSFATLVNGMREWMTVSDVAINDEDFLELGHDFVREGNVMKGRIGQPEYGTKRSRHASKYSYRPLLHTRDTRVAILEPADQFNDPIRLSLKRISLTGLRGTKYEALSYVWGSVTGDCRVHCDGKLLYVTSNCESALRHLRLKKRSRVLWIDALCINQGSNAEKMRQVPMMGDIYESAGRVLLWLGPGNKDITAVFRRATLLHPFISSPLYALRSFGPKVGDQVRKWNLLYSVANWLWHLFAPNSQHDAKVMSLISRNEWFSRMWTIQEHLLAKHSVLVAGHASCSWTAFSSYWMWSIRRIQSLKDTSLPASLRIAIWIAFKNAAAARNGQTLTSAPFNIFSGFIECARTHRSRDPRDKVFAFLPLIYKLERRIPRLPINYSLSPGRIFEDFARYTIRLSSSLKYLESLPPLKGRSSLPSWVMDVQIPAKFPMRRWAESQLHAKATGSSKVDLELLKRSQPRELLLRGLGISHITTLSAPGPLEAEDPDELKQWFFGWIRHIGRSVQKREINWAYHSVESGLQEFIDGVFRFDPFLGGSILFLTASGHVGVSNFDLQLGDQIVLLAGCSFPVILRPSTHHPGKAYFLGVTYVAGISHGEAWYHEHDTSTKINTKQEIFTLI
ncbi:aminoglycoside n [Fusarium longipes]|uniref:Aminoglycoside n n=1 Tax=Fusarium longipes TaxID=694270 RepID=A0A395T2K3_9HYPO|nr:aminoglycoside n [Fusarium longipes]